MNLISYIKSLGYGVLNNTMYATITDMGDMNQILPIITCIDEGLSRLYSRFYLRERHVVIQMQEGVTFYHFDKKYSVQNGDPFLVPDPYIMDLPNDPFDQDLIKVMAVHDVNNKQYPLDDPSHPDSVFMVQYNVLHQPKPVEGDPMYVTYQAHHVPLFVRDPITDLYEIESEFLLPPVLESALSNYVAWMVYSRINTQEAAGKAASHLMLYEEICKEVERNDLVNGSRSCTNERFSNNGWL